LGDNARDYNPNSRPTPDIRSISLTLHGRHDTVNEMLLKDDLLSAIGMISIALGILIGRFVPFEYSGFSISAFVEGVLVGLSMVMNLAYLIRRLKL